MRTVIQILLEAKLPRGRVVQALKELLHAGFIGWDGQQWIILPERAVRYENDVKERRA